MPNATRVLATIWLTIACILCVLATIGRFFGPFGNEIYAISDFVNFTIAALAIFLTGTLTCLFVAFLYDRGISNIVVAADIALTYLLLCIPSLLTFLRIVSLIYGSWFQLERLALYQAGAEGLLFFFLVVILGTPICFGVIVAVVVGKPRSDIVPSGWVKLLACVPFLLSGLLVWALKRHFS